VSWLWDSMTEHVLGLFDRYAL